MGLMTPSLLSTSRIRRTSTRSLSFLSSRLFVLLSLSFLLLSPWAQTAVCATPVAVDLSNQVLQFIPECAQECFTEFVNLDLSTTNCGSDSSLQCLCAQTGIRGFTLGEIAVQCLFALTTVGECLSEEVDSAAYNEALLMCNGQVSAAPRTHTAINATVVVPESGTGSIVIETPTSTGVVTTTTSSRTSRTSAWSSYKTMSTVLATKTTSGTTTRSSSASTSSPTSSSTAATTPEKSDEPNASPGASIKGDSSGQDAQDLTTSQVVGIITGSVGFAILLVGAIILYCRKRRKSILVNSRKSIFTLRGRRHSSDSDIGFGPPMNGLGGSGSSIRQSLRPTMFPRTSMDDSKIGLAIAPIPSQSRLVPSPKAVMKQKIHPFPLHPQAHNKVVSSETFGSMPLRKGATSFSSPYGPYSTSPEQSTETPAKPVLTLTIPDSASDRGPPVPPKRETAQSSLLVTPFEEDGYEDSPEPTSTTQIWRPPPSAGPHSAGIYYVADKYGNWVLGDPNNPFRRSGCVELEAPSELTKSPIERHEEEAQRRMALAARKQTQSRDQTRGLEQGSWPARGSSRNHPASDAPQQQEQTRKRASWAVKFNPLQSQRRGPTPAGNQRDRSHSRSSDSVTTIDSSETDGMSRAGSKNDSSRPLQDQSSRQQQLSLQTPAQKRISEQAALASAGLSPVAESPASSGGKSPVTYPRIPRPTAVGFARLERRPSQTIRRVTSKDNGQGQGHDQRQISDQDNHNQAGRRPPRRIETVTYRPPGQPSPTLGITSLASSDADDFDDEALYPKPLSPKRGQSEYDPANLASLAVGVAGQSRYRPGDGRSLTDRYNQSSKPNNTQYPSTMSPLNNKRPPPRDPSNSGIIAPRTSRPLPPLGSEGGSGWGATSPRRGQQNLAYQQLMRQQHHMRGQPQSQSQTQQGMRLDMSSPTPPPIYRGPRTSNSGTTTTPTNSEDPFTFVSPDTTHTRTSTPGTTSSGFGVGRSGSVRQNQHQNHRQQRQQYDQREQPQHQERQHGYSVHIAQMQSPTSATTTMSVTSSLLSKRLGSGRAAQMVFDAEQGMQEGQQQKGGGRGNGGKWTRAVDYNQHYQRDQSLLSPFSASGGTDIGNAQGPRGRPPMSPLWIPKLTPTRRGEDLFLNVQ